MNARTAKQTRYSLLAAALFLGALSIVPQPAATQPPAADPQPEVRLKTEKTVLPNGLTVLMTPMPESPVVSVYMLVKTGSATEGKYLGTGVSHFLEHMLFKGTERRGVGRISAEVQALGGVINASTSFDYTIYTITLPADSFAQGLDIISDMMMNSVFDAEEIEKEREVVYSEMRMRNDRPGWYHSQNVFKTVYLTHPYRVPIIGHKELLAKLTRADFVDYYRERYVPNNMILSVAGRIDPKGVLPQIEETYKDFERGMPAVRNLAQEGDQISSRFYEEEYPTELLRLSMVYQSVSLRDPDLYALDVLAMILGQGESSRLYQDLLDRRKAVRSITASNYTPMDRGAFEIEAALDAEKLGEAVAGIKENIRHIQEKGVSADELDKAKRQVLSRYIHELQLSEHVAYSTAMDEAFLGDHSFSRKYIQAVGEVTPQDIQRVAKKYLTDRGLSVVVLKPRGKEAGEETAAETPEESQIIKTVLPNGITLLFKENRSLPIVSFNLALRGGTRWETPETNGLSELTARVWPKGTRSRSALEITRAVEERGGSLSGFSGRNSFGLGLNVLSQDLDFAVELLTELIKEPAFSEEETFDQKDKLKTAIIVAQDNISHVTGQKMREMLFTDHPLALDPLGTLETVENLSAGDVRAFYQKLLQGGNMVLSVFGDIDAQELSRRLGKELSGIKDGGFREPEFEMTPLPEMKEEKMELPKEQAMVMLGYQGVGVHHADRFPVTVMSSILGSSFSGRLFTQVRDQFGGAYTVGGSFVPALDGGYIYFYALTREEIVEEVKEKIFGIIEDLAAEGPTEEELADIKSYMKGTFRMGIQTNQSLGFVSALDELYGLGYDYYQRQEERIDAVTAEDVRDAARKYLDKNRAAVVVTRPAM